MVKDSGAGCFVSCAIEFTLKKVKVSINVKVEEKKSYLCTLMERKFKAALFDLDGTLIDTEDQYTVVWGRIARKYRPDIPDLEYIIKGTTLTNILATYFSPETHEAVIKELDAFEAQMDYSFFPFVEEFLTDIRSHGVKCAIATSSNKQKMLYATRNNPLIGTMFDKILTAEDFSASKPNPDCYLKAAEALQMPLDSCIVFEDAYTGLQAGMASGIYTVGLATGHTIEEITPLCHKALKSFEGVGYEDLIHNA